MDKALRFGLLGRAVRLQDLEFWAERGLKGIAVFWSSGSGFRADNELDLGLGFRVLDGLSSVTCVFIIISTCSLVDTLAQITPALTSLNPKVLEPCPLARGGQNP